MRYAVVALLVLSAAVLCTSCAEEETFGYCEFDPCLWEQCSQEAGTVEGTDVGYSCAVPQHPQCPDSVCLRYEGSGPFCTKVCDPGVADDCPEQSACREYLGPTAGAPAIYYCIPETVPEADPDDGGECTSLE